MDLDFLYSFFNASDVVYSLCGSRATCRPPPMNTDIDFLVEVVDVAEFCEALSELGFVREGNGSGYSEVPTSGFSSWRMGQINLIVTSDLDFIAKHKVATALCSQLNLMDKKDRIALFQAVLYGRYWDGKAF